MNSINIHHPPSLNLQTHFSFDPEYDYCWCHDWYPFADYYYWFCNILLGFVFVGASFGALSNGRVSIIGICRSYLSNAIIIAVRYSAVRKQFGSQDGNEFPVLEYQLQVQNNSVIFLWCLTCKIHLTWTCTYFFISYSKRDCFPTLQLHLQSKFSQIACSRLVENLLLDLQWETKVMKWWENRSRQVFSKCILCYCPYPIGLDVCFLQLQINCCQANLTAWKVCFPCISLNNYCIEKYLKWSFSS